MIYVIAGLPIAIRGPGLAPSRAARQIRVAFAKRYWRPASAGEAVELVIAILLAPLAVPLGALWFTARDGPAIRGREGKGLARQFVEQLRLYARAGIVGPWYYILSLHRDGVRRAPTFLQRCETKHGIYELLSRGDPTLLADKDVFADSCASAGVRCVACEHGILESGGAGSDLPSCDLFVKPQRGRGGRGAERWDWVGRGSWSNGSEVLGRGGLLEHLRAEPEPYVVQRRVRPHPSLVAVTSGALPTVRALTIPDERGSPELVAAVFRMSIGANRTVDNIHAGGLACAVSLDDGVLGMASNLGADARLGWVRHHPTTGAPIKGMRLPYWPELCELALRAHCLFAPRIVIGWDIAIAQDGPLIVEGNRGPDMDLMQRFMDVGFCQDHRFGELLAHHLQARPAMPPVHIDESAPLPEQLAEQLAELDG